VIRCLPLNCWGLLQILLSVVVLGCGSDDVLPPEVASPRLASSQVDLFGLAWEDFDRIGESRPDQAFDETINRLNQWALSNVESSADVVAWQVDPLVKQLPPALRDESLLQRLASEAFAKGDAAFLHEAILMRDASRYIVGDAKDAVEKTQRLFDWTVRNIRLDPFVTRLWPRENLLLGRAAQIDREWVFMMLARQQGLKVVWLATSAKETGGFRLWCPALCHEGELYPFDLLWGAPIPSADGKSLATLTEAAANETLLKTLDVPGKPYPISVADLDKVAVLIAAREQFLSRRMLRVQRHLADRFERGKSASADRSIDERLVLHVAATDLAKEIEGYDHVETVRLWTWPLEYGIRMRGDSADGKRYAEDVRALLSPFEVEHFVRVETRESKDPSNRLQPGGDVERGYETHTWPLWTGRLHHLAGRLEADQEEESRQGSESAAIPFYLLARTTMQDLARLQQSQKQLSKQQVAIERYKFSRLRLDSDVWLGMIRYEQQDYANAVDFYGRALKMVGTGPDASPIRYNLGRALEAMGKTDEAIEHYRKERSPASLLRVREIESRQGSETEQHSKPDTEPTP